MRGSATIQLPSSTATSAGENLQRRKNARKANVQVTFLYTRECLFTFPCHFNIVNGGWSDYQVNSVCSVTCGKGQMTLIRHCDNPSPAFGGSNCVGEQLQARECEETGCPGFFPFQTQTILCFMTFMY